METQEEIYNENVLNERLDIELEKIRIDLEISETDFVRYLKGFVEFKENRYEVINLICEGVISKIPADMRLDREEAKRLNGKEQKETIAMQSRLLELERQREIDIKSAKRDSCSLYDNNEVIFGSLEEFVTYLRTEL